MASLIVFDSKGKAKWIPLRSGECLTHTLPARPAVEFTEADKAWFRKPLGR